MSLMGTTVSLMLGTVMPQDAPGPLVECVRSVQVTQGETGSGFQIAFDVEPAPGASTSTGPAHAYRMLLKPWNRVVVTVSLNGTPTTLIDGVITHLELAPAQGGQPSTLTVTGSDLSAVMDLVQESLEYPAMLPEAIVAMIVAGYAHYGMIPMPVPTALAAPLLPSQGVPIKNGTDLAYIRCLAAQYGYDFYVYPGRVPLTSIAYWGPQVRIGPVQPALSVNLGPATNVDALTFSYDATAPTIAYGSVLDTTSNMEVPVLGVPLIIPPLAREPAVVVNLPYVRASLFKHQGLSVLEAQALADSIATRSSQDVVVARGELDAFRYGTALTARSLVGVRGAGHHYDGLYYVRSVTHTIETGAWRQAFELVREGLGSTVSGVTV